MAVTSQGNYTGSIGGGVMEHNIIKQCKLDLKKNARVNKIETLYHNNKKSTVQSGLICSGAQTNFTTTLDKKDVQKVKSIVEYLKEHKSGRIIFSNEGIDFKKETEGNKKNFYVFESEKNWRYEEAIGFRNSVIVAGCGHVGLAVCRLMSMLDFHVVAYDDREELKMIKEHIFADEIIFDSYVNIGNIIKNNGEEFVVIVTTGFKSDEEVLRNVIKKNVRYIGLMGTSVKIKKIFNEAVKTGIEKELLKKVHAPIGIDIGSDTPEEIAVSIAAEIIREKNKM